MEKLMHLHIQFPVQITYADIVEWLTHCEDPNTLKTISVMADRYAEQILNEPGE